MELSNETFQLILDKIDSLEKSMSDKIDALSALLNHKIDTIEVRAWSLNPINIDSRV